MKLLDKIITVIFMIVLLFLIVTNIAITLKVLGVLLFCAYFIFIAMHLGLGVPFFVVILMFNDATRRLKIVDHIREFSNIIYYLLYLIFLIIWITFVYYGIPLIAAMLWNMSIDINAATELLKYIS